MNYWRCEMNAAVTWYQRRAGTTVGRLGRISFLELHTLAPTAQFVLGDPDATGHTVRSPGIQWEVGQINAPSHVECTSPLNLSLSQLWFLTSPLLKCRQTLASVGAPPNRLVPTALVAVAAFRNCSSKVAQDPG